MGTGEFHKDNRKDREQPALRKLAARPSLEMIRTRVDTRFADDCAMARRVGLYPCRRLTGLKLKEIGAAYEVGESAVTLAGRHVAESMKHNPSMRNSVEILENVLRVSRV